MATYREGKGIWGTWEIGIFANGGFHIWPRGEQETDTDAASAETAAPVEAIGEDQEAGAPAISTKYGS